MRKRRRTGSRFAVVAACLAGLALASPPDKKKQPQPETALIAGTVFRETGMALAGADVTLAPLAGDSKEKRRIKKIEALTDSRGEFAFRVPAVPSRYSVSVKAAGYSAQQKEVTVASDERIDVFFRLETASK